MIDTIDYNAGLHPQYAASVPKTIVAKVQKKGLPSRYDELEEVSRLAIKFYLSEGDEVKAREIECFRDYILDTEDENL